jgi:hypothetical protein
MTPVVRRPSIASLLVTPQRPGVKLGTATAFVTEHAGQQFLVTNWHVVAGRNPLTGRTLSPHAAVPTQLGVMHHARGPLGNWIEEAVAICDDEERPLWLEHPTYGRKVDVVAIPLPASDQISVYPYKPSDPGPQIKTGPSDPVSIVGFPFGQTGGGALGIWVQGFVATEPQINFNNLPCFLVDSRTRPGQSGSPVVAFRTGTWVDDNDSVSVTTGSVERLLGVYSGRINEESDLGYVWKISALLEILESGVRGRPQLVLP